MKRRLISLALSVVIVMTSVDFSAFAAEPVSEIAVIEENDISEESGEDEEGKRNEQTLSTDERYTETDTEKDIENEIESNKSDKEYEVNESDVIETEKDEDDETNTESEETQTEEVVLDADGNIASGVIDEDYGHITWVIDANGKLTVEGTGDFSVSANKAPPWCSHPIYIRTAIVDVTGMTNASYIFYGCYNLTSLNLYNFDTSNVTNMSHMFRGCNSLTSLNLYNFDTSNVTNMSHMFGGCNSLTSLDVSNLDTSNVTDMSDMFGCSNLTSLDVSNLDTSNVTDMSGMFRGCSSLTSLDVSNLDTSNVTDMSGMFAECSSLTSLDLSNLDTSNVTDMGSEVGMFERCSSLANLNLSNLDTSNVTSMSRMFCDCSSLTNLDVSNLDTSNVIDMRCMFYDCSSLTNLDVSNLDTSNVTVMGWMFFDCSNLTRLDVSNFDTSNVTVMGWMFGRCSSLTSLDVSNLDTSNVTNMNDMFAECSSLTSLDLSSFDTSNVTTMNGVFAYCSNLTSLDLSSSFDTSHVTDMSCIFMHCSSLKNLDVSNFDTSHVTNMEGMFFDCSNLTRLDVSNFDTSHVTNMLGMFCDCSSLTSLDVSNFDTSHVTDMSRMFEGCSSLKTIYSPYNVHCSVELPIQSDEHWYLSDGTVVMELPQNLNYSVEINKIFRIYSFDYDENTPSKELAVKCALYSLLAYRESKLNKKGVLVDDSGLIKDGDRERLLGDNLHEDGYEDIYSYNYDNVNKVIGYVTSQKYKQTENSILYTIGHRNIETKNGDIQDQIVIVFRGTHDEEWYGNFDITGVKYNPNIDYHESFQSAVNDSMKSLYEYITEMSLNSKLYGSDLSILITGHSRGAAVANMMAHELTDIRDGNVSGYTDEMNVSKFSNYKIASVYAYTYATPNVATYDKIKSYGEYSNIFNYCFTDDFVPNLPMEGWSWGKYGRTYWAQATNVNVDLTFQKAVKDYYGKTAQFNTKYTNNIVSTILKATNPSGVDSYYNFKRNRTNPWDKISLYEFVRVGLGGTMQGKANGYATLLGVYAVAPPLADEHFFELSDNFIFGGKVNPALNYAHQCASYYIAMTISFSMFKYSELNENGYAATTYSIDALEFNNTTEYDEKQVAALKEFLTNEITIEEYDYTVTNAELLEWDIDDISTWKGVVWDNGSVVSLDLSYAGIIGPLDLSAYTELVELDCSYGSLTELDFSNCRKLSKLICDGNQLTTLDLSGFGNLHEISCAFNKLTDLNLDGCTNLESFSCNANQLFVLHLDNCTNLNYLSCDYNYLDVNDSEFSELVNNINAREDGLAEYLPQNIAPNATFFQNDVDYLIKIANNKTNNEILNWDINDPSSWNEVEWELNQGIYYLKGVDFRSLGLNGTVEFDNCTYLDYLLISDNQFDDISLDNCTALTVLWCDYNYLDVDKLEEIASRYEDINAILLPQITGDGDNLGGEDTPPEDNPGEEDTPPTDTPEKPSENEDIWGDIIVEDRPLSANDIPDGLWVGGISEAGYSYTGDAVIPVIRVYDKTTILAEKSDYVIAYKNNINKGNATIIVTGKGNYSGKETATFNILPADISGDDFSAEEFYVKIGKKAQSPVPELYYMGTKLKHKKDFTIKYSNTSGVYEHAGEYSATITGTGNYTGIREIKLTAVTKIEKRPSVNIAKASLVGFEQSFPYTGKSYKQTCTLKMQINGSENTLIEGRDYTVRYINNTKAGTATVIFSGKNGYTGKLKKTYKILPYDITENKDRKITYNKTITCVYAKGGANPKPVIAFDGKTLKEGADYTLSYKNNKTIGSNSSSCVTISGKGNFKGKITIDFTITPQDLSKMTLVSCDKVYKNKAGNYKIVPKLMDLDGKLLSAGKDFDKNSITYVYENNVTLENGVAKKAGDAVEDTDIIPADTPIRVTFGCGTSGNYTGTFTGVYRIVKADIKSAKVTIPNQTYTGKEIKPDKSQISVTLSGTTLKTGDYEILQYTDNVKKGKASVTIKGNGNYGGTKTVKFNIGAKGFLWWKK